MLRRHLILAGLGLLLCSAAMAQEADGPGRLTVTGTGTYAGAPDLATVVVGVSRDARRAEDAIAALGDGLRAVVGRLKDEGVEDRDLQTTQLSLSPRFERGNGIDEVRPIGYVAESRLSVVIRDTGRVGGVIDAAVGDGANRLDGVQFGLANPGAAESEARSRAVADARSKAETLVSAAGVALGPIVQIAEGGNGGPVPMPMMRMEAAADMPIAPGEIETRVDVTITWEIAE